MYSVPMSARRGLARTAKAVTVVAVSLAAVSLAACSKGGSSPSTSPTVMTDAQIAAELAKPTTLTFWTWVSGIQDEVALFEQKYPNIKVNVVNAGQGSAGYTKLRTAITAGSGAPDLAQIEYQELPAFTITGDLADLTPYGAGSIKDKFVDWTWSQVSSGGKIYAIPQDTGPMGMLYRKDIFDKYGISVPTTWDDFAKAARTLHAADPSAYLTDIAPNDMGAFTGLGWQAGSRPFTVAPGNQLTIALNDAGAKKVADFWSPLIKDGVISADADFTDQWYQGLANGTYATWLTAAWGPLFLQGTAKNTAGLWRVAPLPQWSAGENKAGNWGGSTTAVLAQSQNKVAAAVFAQFLNSDPASTQMLSDKQFLFPATKALLADSAFRSQQVDFYGGQTVNQIFADISGTVPADYAWSPFQDYVYSTSTDTLGKAMTNKQDLAASLDQLQSTVVNYAKQQGFTVSG
jgi:multiple sugar transport system substrate-binding protein